MEGYSVLPFTLAGKHFAVPLENAVKVLPALLSTPLPGAPDVICGIVDIQGKILPLIDLSRKFGWAQVPRTLWQPFVWVRTQRRDLLLAVETVGAVQHCDPATFVPAPDPSVPTNLLHGVVRSSEGILLIQDVEQLLSSDEEQCLAAALAHSAKGCNDDD